MILKIAIRIQVVVFLFLLLMSQTADAGPTCSASDSRLQVRAQLLEKLVLRVQIANCTDSSLEFYDNQFRVPFLRLIVVDEHGGPIERFSWIGDRTAKKITLGSDDTATIDTNLSEWYENLHERMAKECFDLFWAIHVTPINQTQAYFDGGALQLNCLVSQTNSLQR